MSIRQLNPYLKFDGNAQQAIELYEPALGAKVENLTRLGDMPNPEIRPTPKTASCTAYGASTRAVC